MGITIIPTPSAQPSLAAPTTAGVLFGRVPSDTSSNDGRPLGIGYNALKSWTNGSRNTAVGNLSLFAVTSGGDNVAVGYSALAAITNAANDSNTAVGSYAAVNLLGNENVAIGAFSLGNTSFSNNYCTAVGVNSLNSGLMNGSMHNIGIGWGCGSSITSGSENVIVGGNSATSLSTGQQNVLIGQYAAASGTNDLTTGSNNIIIGYNAAAASATASNVITLGNSSISTLRCQVTSITALSDIRDKTDVNQIPVGLDFVKDLNPVIFTWNTRPVYDKNGKVIPNANDGKSEGGFIAQELLSTEEKFNTRNWSRIVDAENPDKLEAAPGKLIPILVKAIKELSEKVDALELRVTELESK